ncbi:MAG: fibronectin type III domain-containing protein [Chloroflexi bacterium]|nr:fibronectin type III domain-containing protein [Chloroflexota bacterium]
MPSVESELGVLVLYDGNVLADREADAIPINLNVLDVRHSNVTDVSFTLSFLTQEPVTATVRYWISGTNPALGNVAHDFRTDPGETHWVRIGGTGATDRLQPDTPYQYTVFVNGAPLAHGWVRTGPTLGERSSDGVLGRVVDAAGNGVPGAIVYLAVENLADVISGTSSMHPLSGLLSDVTREDGYWWIDLKAARTQDGLAPFQFGDADQAHLEAFGEPNSFGYADPPVGELRLTPVDLVVRPVVIRPVPLGVGWNAVGLPLESTRPISVSHLARIVNGDGATRLTSAFRYTGGRWQGTAVNGTVLVNPSEDFELRPGEGYFLKVQTPFNWQMVGHEIPEVIPLHLGVGWNLKGVPQADHRWQHRGGLRASSLSDAAGTISGMETFNVREIDRWVYGTYEGHVTGYQFNDFRIEGTKGYFIRANAAGTLVPGLDGYTPSD